MSFLFPVAQNANITLLMSFLIHKLFWTVLLSFQIFEDFFLQDCYLFLMSSPVFWEYMLYNLNPFNFIEACFLTRMWCVLINALWYLEKKTLSCCCEGWLTSLVRLWVSLSLQCCFVCFEALLLAVRALTIYVFLISWCLYHCEMPDNIPGNTLLHKSTVSDADTALLLSHRCGVVHCPPCGLVISEECLVWILSFLSSLRKCALTVGFTFSVMNDRIGFAVIFVSSGLQFPSFLTLFWFFF